MKNRLSVFGRYRIQMDITPKMANPSEKWGFETASIVSGQKKGNGPESVARIACYRCVNRQLPTSYRFAAASS
jgi:hypothetical protein